MATQHFTRPRVFSDGKSPSAKEMRMKKLLLSFALLAFSLPAFAQTVDFTVVDGDGDGFVTVEELGTSGASYTEEEFGRADADGDGMLNDAEYAALIAT
jgi:hypothetical protein